MFSERDFFLFLSVQSYISEATRLVLDNQLASFNLLQDKSCCVKAIDITIQYSANNMDTHVNYLMVFIHGHNKYLIHVKITNLNKFKPENQQI